MDSVREIEKAVTALPDADYGRFRRWFLKRDWEKWDRELDMRPR